VFFAFFSSVAAWVMLSRVQVAEVVKAGAASAWRCAKWSGQKIRHVRVPSLSLRAKKSCLEEPIALSTPCAPPISTPAALPPIGAALSLSPENAPLQLPLPLPANEALFPLAAPVEKDAEMGKLASAKNPSANRETKPAKTRGQQGPFSVPSLALLSGKADSKMKSVDRNWYLEKSKILVEKLRDFGVDGEVVNISPGPVITVYEFKPASGVKIKEIANLSDDLTLALSVLSVRIVAPIPGKPVVGIEIPSPHREMVFFKDIVEETGFYNADVKLPLVLGRLASGEPAIAGLAAMPHLLVAGSTGTGKSVFINTMICSLLFRYTPQQLKLILVDPKMVELAAYEGIPHLLLPVVVDSRKAALALRWTVEEMERRYSLMHQMGVRQVDAYNARIQEAGETDETPFMPYIVVVIDEYADLMAVVPKDVELSIARLAQKARASGIHLVLATQRPSTDVVTGTIKANFPSRLSFRVASSIDSKTILDRTGADRLLGNGDMLFHSAGFTTLKRIQGAFISDADLDKVVESLRAQGEPEYDERLLKAQDEGELDYADGGLENAEQGDLYDRAVRLVSEKGEASISLIQRHLRIGYNRAASLMEEMEKQGVVAGASGASKRRAVLVNSL
jgi:S-DNA-T family DNA segregation ATPase FtsK/SpoIIIE